MTSPLMISSPDGTTVPANRNSNANTEVKRNRYAPPPIDDDTLDFNRQKRKPELTPAQIEAMKVAMLMKDTLANEKSLQVPLALTQKSIDLDGTLGSTEDSGHSGHKKSKKKSHPSERENSLFNRVALSHPDEIINQVVKNRNQLITFEQSELKFMSNLKKKVFAGINSIQDKSFMMGSASTTYDSLVSQVRALEEMSQQSVSSQTKNLYKRNLARKAARLTQQGSPNEALFSPTNGKQVSFAHNTSVFNPQPRGISPDYPNHSLTNLPKLKHQLGGATNQGGLLSLSQEKFSIGANLVQLRKGPIIGRTQDILSSARGENMVANLMSPRMSKVPRQNGAVALPQGLQQIK
ncbi:hypothetical protein FGO68_gene11463 [Halteria grandinella]|uniref:Uncharacterized protein n=1 Tax=Halteria grandinella TaxID=5974 RepID=A0A8J8ND30_HALGN|nr:hypothetical protein FGO68_gene11463 [Halteria grandinella]